MEIHFKQKSKGSSGGKSSSNVSEQEKTRRVVEPSVFTTLPEGWMVLSGPGQRSKKGSREEAFLPIVQKVKIPQAEIDEAKQSVAEWSEIRAEFIADSKRSSHCTVQIHYGMSINFCLNIIQDLLFKMSKQFLSSDHHKRS